MVLQCSDYPHLYINLDRRPERAKAFEFDNREAVQSCNIKRLSAVEGKKHFTRSPDKENRLKRGELGCIASHKNAWKHISDTQKAFGVVFEDDSLIDQAYAKDLPVLLEEAMTVCDRPVVYLDRTTWDDISGEPRVTPHLRRVTKHSYGMHAYALSRGAAEYLAQKQIDKALDVFMWDHIHPPEDDKNSVCLLRAERSLARVPQDTGSTTQED